MERRIAPPASREALLDKLVEAMKLFDTKAKALVYAAALGWHLGEPREVEGRGEGIRVSVFQSSGDAGFVDALAVAQTKDLRVLGSEREEERVTVFEQFAAAGLEEMQRRCIDQQGDPLMTLLEMSYDARKSSEESTNDGIVPGLLRNLLG